MKKLIVIFFITVLCLGCTVSRNYVVQEDVDKINEHEAVAEVVNTIKSQDFKSLSEMFDVDTGNLKNRQFDKTWQAIFERTNYRIESITETETEIVTTLNINMPFTHVMSNVATAITLKKTTKSDGTHNFDMEPGEAYKIWNKAFIKQLKSDEGARIVYNYELKLVKVNDKWTIKNDPAEFLGIFFGDYVEGYSNYWYEENPDYSDLWLNK